MEDTHPPQILCVQSSFFFVSRYRKSMEDRCLPQNVLHRVGGIQTKNNGSLKMPVFYVLFYFSAFTDYCECIEPKIYGCSSIFIKRYHMNQETYSAPPYNCTLPTVPPGMEWNDTDSSNTPTLLSYIYQQSNQAPKCGINVLVNISVWIGVILFILYHYS